MLQPGEKLLVVTCGAPGSGKSTAIEPVAYQYGLAIICPDTIRGELFGDEGDQRDGWRVFQIAYERLREALCDSNCNGAIFDATNCRRKARRDVLAAAEGFYSQSICAVATTDLETCLFRNAGRARQVPEDVIANMHNNLSNCWPDASEGFDRVVALDFLGDELFSIFN